MRGAAHRLALAGSHGLYTLQSPLHEQRHPVLQIVPEINGRVAEVYVGPTGEVKRGAPIFRLDSSTQEAAAEAWADLRETCNGLR